MLTAECGCNYLTVRTRNHGFWYDSDDRWSNRGRAECRACAGFGLCRDCAVTNLRQWRSGFDSNDAQQRGARGRKRAKAFVSIKNPVRRLFGIARNLFGANEG